MYRHVVVKPFCKHFFNIVANLYVQTRDWLVQRSSIDRTQWLLVFIANIHQFRIVANHIIQIKVQGNNSRSEVNRAIVRRVKLPLAIDLQINRKCTRCQQYKTQQQSIASSLFEIISSPPKSMWLSGPQIFIIRSIQYKICDGYVQFQDINKYRLQMSSRNIIAEIGTLHEMIS